MERIIKSLLIIFGTIFVAIGMLGVVLPLLPTTPFLLLGAACYVRGSERLYNWLVSNRLFGEHIKNYREGKGIPLKTKIWAITLLWITISSSIVFFITSVLVRIVLFCIATGVTLHIYSIRTLEKS